jgi:GTP-binding protein
VPFARIFTKSDKLGAADLENAITRYDKEMLINWESLPETFISSVKNGAGRIEILDYIEESINKLSNEF